MRNEDDAFADIIQREFDEQWTPRPEPTRESTPPAPDFHLNLYDDEESYRDAPDVASSLSGWTLAGLGLMGAGGAITLLRALPLGTPGWMGWIGIACFVAGVAVSIWHLTSTRRPTDDEDAV